MSLGGYIYTKEKEMPASEAGIEPYWRSENRKCKDRVTTVNEDPVGETGHNLHAQSPQETEVYKSRPAKQHSSIGGNKKIKQNQKLVPVLIRLKFDEFRRNSTNFRRYVVVDQTS